MRRMPAGVVLAAPNENNKVFCGQFVADELIANNIQPGMYCVRLVDTQHHVEYPISVFLVKEPEEYHGTFFLDINDLEVELRFRYNRKDITFSLYALGAISVSDYHIDLFKLV